MGVMVLVFCGVTWFSRCAVLVLVSACDCFDA